MNLTHRRRECTNASAFGLEGRVAVVTGAARGIGEALSIGLAAEGVSVVIADVDASEADVAARRIAARGGDATAVEVDVRDSTSIEQMADLCMRRWGRIDILINNAAVVTTGTVAETSEEDWRRVLDVNLTGAFLCSQAVLPAMLQQGRGKIVNVASVAAKRISFNGAASYSAAKAGLLAFTRHLAYEVAGRGVNVNAICPGPTLTPLMEGVADEATLHARRAAVPRGRLAIPEDHLGAVLFLISDLSDMVCGIALDVDGGALLGWEDVDTYMQRRRKPLSKEQS